MRRAATLFAVALLASGCASPSSFVATDILVESRGQRVPATFVRPGAGSDARSPLVVFAHGHGGTREEAGGFTRVAEALADRGIASIRVDFPGCGESTEPFTKNNLSNMRLDLEAALDFALQDPAIDAGRVGVLGYSMGGRLAMLASEDAGYAAIVLWAPVATNGSVGMHRFMGGRGAYEALQTTAESEGSVAFVTPWGQRQELSSQWFADMASSRPLQAIREYRGALLVLYGKNDDVIDPGIAKSVIEAASGSRALFEHAIEGAGHGLGFFTGDEALAESVIERTAAFFRTYL